MRFMIIAARRSGSSHLVNTLGGHPEITCHGNVFSPGMLPLFWPKNHPESFEKIATIKAELKKLREEDSRAFLKRVFAISHGRPHVGFKIFPRQDDTMLKKVIKSPSVQKIVLIRSNVLARYASQLVARESGEWGRRKGDDPTDEYSDTRPKVCFDAEEFQKFYNSHSEYYSDVLDGLLANRQVYHLVRYEELNDPLLVNSIVNFIGADPGKPILESEQRRLQVKQGSSDIISRFSNTEEVRDFIETHNISGWAYEAQTATSSSIGNSGETLQE